MPLYEYECPACQKVHEVMQKFSDAPLAECPDCQGPVSKLVSMSSFALKGSGWYATDYKKSSKPAAAPAATPATGTAPAAAPSATASTSTTAAPAASAPASPSTPSSN